MSKLEGKDAPPIEVAQPDFESEAETLILFWSDDPEVVSANNILAKRFGREHGKTTLHRWANGGYPLRDGTDVRVRLPGETRLLNNPRTGKPHYVMVTTEEAVQRFIEKVEHMLGSKVKAPLQLPETRGTDPQE